jgi:uncharacterized protein
MTLGMYSASVPVFVRGLENLADILAKGQSFVAEKGLNEQELVQARLIEDMLPLTRQIQIASDIVKFAAARLAGVDAPSMDDTEASFEELQARITKTISFLKSVDAAKLDGTEAKAISFSNKGGDYSFNGRDYLFQFAYPNFFFHVTTAYDILRAKGVQIGKKDFLGVF